jgi:N-hydroxyarylamine O-acetyltransferase
VTVFDQASLDLDAYLARIDYRGPVAARLDTLQDIALRHPLAIPFENLNPLLGRPVALDVASLQQKLLRDGRGGWCFEHNVLLGTALAAIGFDVTGLAARVMWNMPAGATLPRSHMVLQVILEGQVLIVDAGFGGLTLTGPLRLVADVEQDTPHERFRLIRANEYFVVEARVRDEWKALYRFDRQWQAIADYEVTNWYLSTNPKSHFLTTLVAARVQADRRFALRNTDFAIHHRGGYTERRALASAQELRDTLEQTFGIKVPAGPEMDAVFERIMSSAATPAVTT